MEQKDGAWVAGESEAESSEDESVDNTFKPVYAFWAEKGLIAAKNMRRQHTRKSAAKPFAAANLGKKHKIQGGAEWNMVARQQNLLNLGASQIPETCRKSEVSDLGKARCALALSTPPKKLPCREAEREQISSFVQEAVQAGSDGLSGCLYVSGVPGTGKTATVLEVVRNLRRQAEMGSLPQFQFVEINSLRLPSPHHAYTHLYEALTGQHLSPAVALTHLEQLFTSPSTQKQRHVTVVLVDEIDLLVTRTQQVLYNLFEWPTRKNSRLAMIAVANTMDLPERLLPRIASRLGSRRLVFRPYNRPQLSVIINARLEEAKLPHTFAANAINMACSKVAGVSGDVRRVMQLCRKATEICEAEGCTQVAMRHINLAVEEMFSAAHMQLLANCSSLEKLLLASLLLEIHAKGRGDAVLEDVVFRLQQIGEVRSLASITFGDCLASCNRLGAKKLLLTEVGGKRLRLRLSLNVPRDDVIEMLQNEPEMPWLKDSNF